MKFQPQKHRTSHFIQSDQENVREIDDFYNQVIFHSIRYFSFMGKFLSLDSSINIVTTIEQSER